MAARAKSKITPKYKTKYKVNNWPVYQAAVRKRGDVMVWSRVHGRDPCHPAATPDCDQNPTGVRH